MKHQVEYLSPGTLFPEESYATIAERDAGLAVAAAPATAYCFTMYDLEEAPDLGPDFTVHPKPKNRSGRFYIGGTIYTLAELEEKQGVDSIIAANMRGNEWEYVIQCRTGNWQPFVDGDTLLPGPT